MEQKMDAIIQNMEQVMVGKREAVELAVITLLSEGHLLIEDVPGVGKTTLAKALAKSLNCKFNRIQFTPDTLPSDVTGVSIYQMEKGIFTYLPGGIMSQIVLADEINRATPKTQSSLLEAMGERQVSVDGKTYVLPRPFMVIATENPIDELGTYPLPEAQLDRFFMRISIGYPNLSQEEEIVQRFLQGKKEEQLFSMVSETEVLQMQEEVKEVFIHQDLVNYLLQIVEETRHHKNIALGASTRALLALVRGAQASAYCDARKYVIPDDILKVMHPILCHRILLTAEANMQQLTVEQVLAEIRSRVVLPILSEDSLSEHADIR